MLEEECIQQLNAIVRPQDIQAVPDEGDERGGQAAPSSSKDEQLVKGSINDLIKENTL